MCTYHFHLCIHQRCVMRLLAGSILWAEVGQSHENHSSGVTHAQDDSSSGHISIIYQDGGFTFNRGFVDSQSRGRRLISWSHHDSHAWRLPWQHQRWCRHLLCGEIDIITSGIYKICNRQWCLGSKLNIFVLMSHFMQFSNINTNIALLFKYPSLDLDL